MTSPALTLRSVRGIAVKVPAALSASAWSVDYVAFGAQLCENMLSQIE